MRLVKAGSMRSSEESALSWRKTSSPFCRMSALFDAVETAPSSSEIWSLRRPARSDSPFVTQTSRDSRSTSVTGNPWWMRAAVTGTATRTDRAVIEAAVLRLRSQPLQLLTIPQVCSVNARSSDRAANAESL